MDTNAREISNDESPKTSRRAFLATAAGAAGAVGAVGAGGALLGRSAEASVAFAAAPLATSISTARELLYLDGASMGILTGRSGGLPFVERLQATQPGAESSKFTLGTVKYEPLVLQFGVGMPNTVSKWIADSLQLLGPKKSGYIAFVTFDGTETGRLTFNNALISEVTLPALDGASKDSASLTITLAPEFTQLFLSPSAPVKHMLAVNATKGWLASRFRVRIDKIDASTVATVDSQTTTIKIANLQAGQTKFPAAAPTGIENGNLSISVSERDAKQYLDWFNQLWGQNGNPANPEFLRTVTIDFLASDLKTSIGSVMFSQVGVAKVAPERASVSEAIRRVKVDLYVGSVALDPKSFS